MPLRGPPPSQIPQEIASIVQWIVVGDHYAVLMADPATITAAIAANVRGQRAHRGMTLDELAARSNVSRGMLIQVEQGRTNPSVNTLSRIADALGVTLARLVEVADTPVVRVVHESEVVTFRHPGEGRPACSWERTRPRSWSCGTGGSGRATTTTATRTPPAPARCSPFWRGGSH
ncbi:hypothetical protein GCM10027612_76890 [Microbispora bryophytorum subsp. camponoti]